MTRGVEYMFGDLLDHDQLAFDVIEVIVEGFVGSFFQFIDLLSKAFELFLH